MKHEDPYSLKIVSDPHVSGDVVYFTLNWIEEGEYKSSVYSFDGQNASRVTFDGCEKRPAVNGGKLYYIAYSKDEESLVQIDGLKGPRTLYTNRSISKYIFHGESIIVIAQDRFDKDAPFVTERIKYRFDTEGFLRARKKLICLNDRITDLVTGDFDVLDVASNGDVVVFSATIEDDDRGSDDVYQLDMDSLSYKRLTEGQGEAASVCVSPDGSVSCIGHRKGLEPWNTSSLMLISPERKDITVGNTAGNSVGTDLFVPGSNQLLFSKGKHYLIGQEGGSSSVYSYDGNKVERLTELGISVRAFHASGDKLAYVYTSQRKPSILMFNGLYDPNPEVEGHSADLMKVGEKEAWFMKASSSAPTVVAVHGGPQTAYGYAYSIEFNFLVDNGFNVLYGNPVGSSGYGEEFAAGCAGDWGGADFEDIVKFLEHAREKYRLPDRFAITGGSYGGYMTNTAITRTDIFKCAVSERCVSNLMSMCGTSDIGFWFNAVEAKVEDPWSEEGMKKLLEMSPVTRAKNVRTPTMFIHGEEDYRCPIEQSEQMYTALKMNGVEAVLARYQGDSHEHARRGVPDNMQDRLRRKLAWFRKYLSE